MPGQLVEGVKAPPGGVLDRLGRPAELVQGTRWLFLMLAVVSLLITFPAAYRTLAPTTAVLLVAGSTALIGSWLYGYLSRSAPVALDVLDAAALAAVALSCASPAPIFAVLFSAVWFRSLYGSTTRAVFRTAGYVAGLVATLPLWGTIPGHAATTAAAPVLTPIPALFITVVVGRQLAIGLSSREQGRLRDAALAAVGTNLLGVTDPVRIQAVAWQAADEICAATPGLRIMAAVRVDGGLRPVGSAGGWAAVPAVVPDAVVPARTAPEHPATVTVTGPLDAAAGTACAWVCVPLPGRSRGVAFVGAPGRIATESIDAIRSVMNQFALALRNSEIHGELTTQARTDALTGLANRTTFHAALAAAVRPGAAGAAVLFADLDDFKNVNDVLGHAAGDHLLQVVARGLRTVVREGDLGARLGGDEFAVLLRDVPEDGAEAIAERLVRALAVPVRIDGRIARVGASVGLAYATAGAKVEDVVHHADVAMYAAKANGKNRVQVYEPELLQGGGGLSFERALAASAGAGELVVHYQPILSLADGRCVAVEALVRWQHPERGLLPPAAFIEVAERTGAILGIGKYVLRRACADAASWRFAHPGHPLAVHVNVSAAQLQDGHLAEVVTRAMAEFSMPPKQLVLEITESMMLGSAEIAGRLEALAACGAAIAVDDFGTGYSTLTTLCSLPIDIVKIDRSFVARGPSDRADQAVIEAIVQMAGKLGMRTVAEGVERVAEEEFLRAAGADCVQGYLHLRPSPAAEFGAWLDAHVAGVREDDRRAGITRLAGRRSG